MLKYAGILNWYIYIYIYVYYILHDDIYFLYTNMYKNLEI